MLIYRNAEGVHGKKKVWEPLIYHKGVRKARGSESTISAEATYLMNACGHVFSNQMVRVCAQG